MEKAEFENIYKNETTHYYYVDSHELVIDLIKHHTQYAANMRILDAGCGTGLLGIKLQSFGQVVGVDINPHALEYARKRGLPVQKASLLRLPFKNGTFDVIISVDVLYHVQISDDVRALRELHRVLSPGGTVILRVPAVPWLRRRHDALVFTRRRYDPANLCRALHDAKFSVIKVSYVQGLLFLFAVCMWVIEKLVGPKRPRSDIFPLPRIINSAILTVLRLERNVSQFIQLPIGLGLVAVAKKTP